MGLAVRVREQQGATVVLVSGAADPELLGELAPILMRAARPDTPLVIDLSETLLLCAPPLREFLIGLASGCKSASDSGLRLVCNRLSGRKAIRRCAPELSSRVFGTVETALADHPLGASA